MKNPKLVFGLLAGASAIALGIGLTINYSNKKKEAKRLAEEEATKRAAQEAADKAAGQNKPATISNYAPTPFKTADEGNRFRKWLNLAHPADAKTLQIDPVGAYDNAYLRKAFYQFGSEYFGFLATVNNILEADKLKKQMADELLKNSVAKKVVASKGPTATVRSGAIVNDGYSNNRLFTMNANDRLDYLGDVKGSDQLTWYKVKIGDKNGLKYDLKTDIGYVRSDVAKVLTIRVPV